MMADTHFGYGAGALTSTVSRLRTYSIVIYVLYLFAVPSIFSTMLLGVALAYLKHGESRGTAFESHIDNAIDIFWYTLVVGVVAIVLWPLFLLGALIHAALLVWVLYRTITGLVRAMEWQPYA